MNKKLVFLDVDGTLCGHDGQVPASATEAIKQARNNGHLMYLCTGRSIPEITPEIHAVGLDGIIGAGGSYIEADGEVLMHKTMDAEGVHAIEAYFKEHNIGYYLETNHGLFASDNCVEAMRKAISKFAEKHPQFASLVEGEESNWFIEILDKSVGKEIDYSQINKISFISNDHPYQAVADTFGDMFEMHHSTVAVMGENSGEVSVKGITKLTAINLVLEHTGIDRKDTLAYGDGMNDVEMFKAVECGIAMANGKPGLLEIADDITPSAEEDGIALSFKKMGLI